MEHDVHQMESPRFKSEYKIGEHKHEVHHRPVVAGGKTSIKTGNMRCKDFRNIPDIFNPAIQEYILYVIIDKVIEEGIEIGTENNKGDREYQN